MPASGGSGGSGLPPDLHHSGWVITAQLTDQTIVTDAGLAVTGVRVFFITGDGNEGSIFVADNHYTLKVVKPAIDAKAALIDTVGQLTAGAA